jgi:hypothetical protein
VKILQVITTEKDGAQPVVPIELIQRGEADQQAFKNLIEHIQRSNDGV